VILIGFHGTSRSAAEQILARGFLTSANEYDWLGDGIYFFQDAPLRAQEWARKHYGAEAAVLRCEVVDRDMMDLLDIKWWDALCWVSAEYHRRVTNLPHQSQGAHRRDRAVINFCVQLMATLGISIRLVRAAFIEGQPLFEASALYQRSHVQFAVRDPLLIVRTILVD